MLFDDIFAIDYYAYAITFHMLTLILRHMLIIFFVLLPLPEPAE